MKNNQESVYKNTFLKVAYNLSIRERVILQKLRVVKENLEELILIDFYQSTLIKN